MTLDELLQNEVRVINVGLEAFAVDLEKQNVPVVHVLWTPQAHGQTTSHNINTFQFSDIRPLTTSWSPAQPDEQICRPGLTAFEILTIVFP